MYYTKESSAGRTRELITISLPPPLLKKAEKVADEENRTKSELFREAIRFYVEARSERSKARRGQVFSIIDKVQAISKRVPSYQIRKVIREAIISARKK